MKIEFVKETKADGTISYSTEINGNYVSGSFSRNYEQAYESYNNIEKNNGVLEIREVLESIEIDEKNKN